ncbi:STAS domain-containing protein [Bacillus dakarensis]|uniref:STAS domain-containing protein n=1 Tax=Robertmurraya dakarensis TaxID=1926278 RepID=UPI0009812FE1|nr:STAS domain-containing protein [Bacillus dakarensis]
MFTYKLDKIDQSVSVQFNGDFDIEVSELIEDEIIPALMNFACVELDFDGVPFVDSTGIGLLLNLIDSLKNNQEDVQIKIKKIQPMVREVFEILQLDEILREKVYLSLN